MGLAVQRIRKAAHKAAVVWVPRSVASFGQLPRGFGQKHRAARLNFALESAANGKGANSQLKRAYLA
jgi:hypothetical protein